jgi:hypothetical protein
MADIDKSLAQAPQGLEEWLWVNQTFLLKLKIQKV